MQGRETTYVMEPRDGVGLKNVAWRRQGQPTARYSGDHHVRSLHRVALTRASVARRGRRLMNAMASGNRASRPVVVADFNGREGKARGCASRGSGCFEHNGGMMKTAFVAPRWRCTRRVKKRRRVEKGREGKGKAAIFRGRNSMTQVAWGWPEPAFHRKRDGLGRWLQHSQSESPGWPLRRKRREQEMYVILCHGTPRGRGRGLFGVRAMRRGRRERESGES